jgi:anti-sigma B factor antagonist
VNALTRIVGNVAIVDLSGRAVSIGGVSPLRTELQRLLNAGHQHILINLNAVPYMDSSGLGDLLAAKKSALVAGAALKLLRPSRHVYSLIAETGLNRVFDCFDDEKVAVRSFGAGDRARLE